MRTDRHTDRWTDITELIILFLQILRTHRKLNNILQGRNCCLFGLSFKTHKACGQDADFCNVKADVPCSNSQLLFLLITNLTHFFQCIYLFPLSTCFEQPSAHHQENQIVPIHHLVYITLCRWLPGMPVLPDRHTRQSPTQSDIYQMMYWHNLILLMMSNGLLETCREGK